MTGCLPQAQDPKASAARCGFGYDASTGNLDLRVLTFPTHSTMVGSPMFAGRAIQASAPLDGFLSASDPSYAGVNVFWEGPEAGSATPMTFYPIRFGEEGPSGAIAMAFPGPASPVDTLLLLAQSTDGGTQTTFSPSFADIERATFDAEAAPDGQPYIAGGGIYSFVIVGDPSAAADSGEQPHVIAFPDDLVPPP